MFIVAIGVVVYFALSGTELSPWWLMLLGSMLGLSVLVTGIQRAMTGVGKDDGDDGGDAKKATPPTPTPPTTPGPVTGPPDLQRLIDGAMLSGNREQVGRDG